ncbi:MAG: class I SAM-dependent DNA methyltransferase [Bacillota bacterium]
MSYQHLAALYDELMQDAPYDEWVSFTESMLESPVEAILDVGCGTGQITRRLSQKGFQMTGVDLSEAMLIEAANDSSVETSRIQWVKQDMRALTGFHDQQLIVSYCDVLNYITEKDDVLKTFQAIHHSLAPEGQFMFDVHSLAHVEAMSDNIYSEVQDDYSYIWFCDQGDTIGEMFHEMTFFIKEGDCYQRYDETHHQRTYSMGSYIDWLKQVGFSDVKVYKDFETAPITLADEPNSERLFFIAKK